MADSNRVFPEVPHVDPNDRPKARADPVASLASREQLVRERMIAVEEMKNLQAQIERCYFTEGVNHFVACRPLVEEYLVRLTSPEYAHPNGLAKLGQRANESTL